MSQKQAKPLSEAEKILAKRILARRRLLQFVQLTHGNYDAGWVHDDICRRLERFSADVAAKKSPRLMLLTAPRHGKSELASIRFPAWHLGQHPEHEIINVGYNLELPMIFSRKVRELARDSAYQSVFPGMELNPDSQSIEKWSTTKGGGFLAAGVGGGITGKGAHILIIDDPIKNQEEADSVEVRNKLLDWYQSTAYTRLAPGGGILLIQCMTGDTPVRLPDGTYKRLDAIKAGDRVATWDHGVLADEVVLKQRSNGYDDVLALTTSSGTVVRANGRHPFLVDHGNGELEWVRMQNLKSGQKIVTVKASGASGKVSCAQKKGVGDPSSVGATAHHTTTSTGGLQGIGRLRQRLLGSVRRISSIAMASLQTNMLACLLRRMVGALCADFQRANASLPSTGSNACASITATTLEQPGGCSATPAIYFSNAEPLPRFLKRPSCTDDFTTETVVSIVPLKVREEVFDLQVNRTENFIAQVVVTHNTCWNDDDLAGRLQNMSRTDEAADQFEVIKYPALSEAWEYRDRQTQAIMRFPEQVDDRADLELLRPIDTCLHEARYPTDALKRIRANMQPRIWSALYQQNPMPDEGVYFRKQDFRYYITPPRTYGMNIFTAWDFAIGEKQQNDWTVGFTMLQDESNALYVLEVVRFKGDSLEIADAILDAALRFGTLPNVNYSVGMEDGQIYRAMKPMLELRMTQRKIWPAYEVLKPFTDKLARARTLQGRMQQGRVFWPDPKYHGWVNQAVTELLRFPGGANDDVVDGGAWAAIMANTAEPPQEEAPKPVRSWKDDIDRPTMDGSHMTA